MSNVNDVNIGDVVSFNSKSPSDHNEYYGQVTGFVNVDIAKSFADVIAYNNNVQTIDSTVPEPSLLRFMILKLFEGGVGNYAKDKYNIPFATDWVMTESFKIIVPDRAVELRVFEVTEANSKDLIDYLRAGGYKARVDRFI